MKYSPLQRRRTAPIKYPRETAQFSRGGFYHHLRRETALKLKTVL